MIKVFKYFTENDYKAILQDLFPLAVAILMAFIIRKHKIVFEESLVSDLTNVAAILFGFSMTFIGILFNANQHPFLKEIIKPDSKDHWQYKKIIYYTRSCVYSTFILLVYAYIHKYDFHSITFQNWKDVILGFIFFFSLSSMLNLAIILLGMLKTIGGIGNSRKI